MRFLPDGSHFASLDRSGRLLVWPIELTPAIRNTGTIEDAPQDVWTLASGRFWLYPTVSNAFECRDMKTGKTYRLDKPAAWGGQAWNTVVAGPSVYSGTPSGDVRRLSVPSLKIEKSIRVFDGPVTGIQKLMDGKRLLVTMDTVGLHREAQFAILDPESLTILHRFKPCWPTGGVNYGNNWFVTSRGDIFAFAVLGVRSKTFESLPGYIIFYSANTGKELKRWTFKREVRAAAFTDDGSKLLVSLLSGDLKDPSNELFVLDVSTGKKLQTLTTPKYTVVNWLDTYGDLVVAQLTDGRIGLWQLSKNSEGKILSPGQLVVFSEMSPERDRILTFLRDGSVVFWDTTTGEELYALQASSMGGGPNARNALSMGAFSANGKMLTVLGADGQLREISARDWKSSGHRK
jgi:WD40 repeat protein